MENGDARNIGSCHERRAWDLGQATLGYDKPFAPGWRAKPNNVAHHKWRTNKLPN